MSRLIVPVFSLLLLITNLISKEYRSFELRYVTNNAEANGETDFKGETDIFNTEQRVEFLNQYAKVASRFFNDPEFNTKVVNDAQVDSFLNQLKPQPLPTVRHRIPLEKWKWTGYKSGLHQQSVRKLRRWLENEDVQIKDGILTVKDSTVLEWTFPSLSWRFSFSWRIKTPDTKEDIIIDFSDRGENFAATVGFDTKGHIFYITADDKRNESIEYESSTWYDLKIEFDFGTGSRRNFGRYNLYVNDKKIADYVPMQRSLTTRHAYNQGFTSIGQVNRFRMHCPAGVMLDDILGTSYHLTGRESYPYTVETFLDETFEIKMPVKGWQTLAYNDSSWFHGVLPIVHGSERHTGEDLYLRRKVYIDEFTRAVLNIETLDPSGDVWINGQIAGKLNNRRPAKLDVTSFLKKNAWNIIAVKVDHFYLTESIGEMMPHSSLDYNIGWFAGRMSLDLTSRSTIEDVFVCTAELSDQARLKTRIKVNHQGYFSLRGQLFIDVYPWFPKESDQPAATARLPVVIGQGEKEFNGEIRINNPNLWSCEKPSLYRVHVILKDSSGNALDDHVLTTGIRTIDQKGGTFRLNNQPAMLNGAQIMGYRGSLNKLVVWNRCAPNDWIARELMMVKKMNGNLLRVHVHGWENPARNINDPRFAEMADQLGIMLIWGTTAWIRTGWGWGQVDFAGYPQYMKQVYNHPSIVIWEVANHTQGFKDRDVMESNLFCDKAYNTVYPLDNSRLISFNSHIRHLNYGNDAGTIDQQGNPINPSFAWTAPKVTRGNQDAITGYGHDWTTLRQWPDAYRSEFLNSRERAYFNFEHEESIGQPNWDLCKGKPWYKMHSYEWDYDVGSIGRRLELDEWQASQAWQAFSAWESMKKQRMLDYDGFSWCCLHGGANTVTYKKPLIDFLGHAKLAYHVNRMIFQNIVAGSNNVDVVFGPNDTLTPIIMNLGPSKTVDLDILINDLEGNVIENKHYSSVHLNAGRNTTVMDAFSPDFPQTGYYFVEYLVKDKENN